MTLDARAARQILGPEAVPRAGTTDPGWHSASEPVLSNDAELALHLENLRAERQRRLTIAIGLVTSVVVLVLAIPLSIVVYDTVRDRVAARNTVAGAPTLVEAIPSTTPVVVAQPAPAPALVAQPAPEDEPVATEAEPARPAGARALIQRGWSLADRSPASAQEQFRQALAVEPGNAEASYGLGYTSLELGDREGARRWLCAALPGADLETRREIQALLARNQISCSS